jgi:hypothetical protein
MKISSSPTYNTRPDEGVGGVAFVSEDEVRRVMSRFESDEGLGQAVSTREPRPALAPPEADPQPAPSQFWHGFLASGLARIVERLR